MALTIGEFKQANPEYANVNDFELAQYLHEKYYSNVPFSNFTKQVGVEDPNAPGDISRGFSTGTEQLKQAGYGILAAAVATGEKAFGEGGLSTGIKKAGLTGYKEQEEKISETAKPSDEITYSWEKAKEGDFGALADWMQYGIGQTGNQAIQALATAGLGGFIAKQGVQYAGKELAAKLVESQAAKIAETEATKIAAGELTKEAIEQQATKMVADKLGNIGATTALGGLAVTQKGGEIGGDLVAKAEKEGRTLTGDELAKAFGYSLGAGALEFVGDKFGLDVLTGKTKFGKTIGGMEGIGGRVARGTTAGLTTAPVEAGTEYGQTLLEEAGKGNDPFSEQARLNAINAAAAGAFGGHIMGFAGGVLTSPTKPEPEKKNLVENVINAPDASSAIAAASEALDEPIIKTPETVGGILKRQTIAGIPVQEAIDRQFPEPSGYRPIGLLGPTHQIEADKIEPDDRSVTIGGKEFPYRNFVIGQITSGGKSYEVAKENFNRLYEEQNLTKPEPVVTEQTAQEIVKPVVEQTKEPAVKPVSQFTPTHELNDGTPVIKVAGETNVYADVSGNEWEADDALPIEKTKAPIVEQQTKEQPKQLTNDFIPAGTELIWKRGDKSTTIKATENVDLSGLHNDDFVSGFEINGGKADAIVGHLKQIVGQTLSKNETPVVEQQLAQTEPLQQAKQPTETAQFRKGEIGGKLSAGEIVTTTSGRQTTPFPKFQTKKGNVKPVHLKAVDKWLMRNAFEEAKTRGDEFNARQFESSLDKPSQSDKESAEEYLFGEQPEVKKPILKSLETKKSTPINSAALKRKADSLIEKANRMESAGGNKDEIKTLRDQAERDYKAAGIKPVATEMEDLKDQMGQAIGELASLLGGKTNLTEEEETKLIPIMSKIFRIAAKMGYVKFKDAAQHVMAQIRELAGDEVADKLSIENLQAGYINIAKEIGGDKLEALQYESIQELEKDQNAIEKQKTSTPNAGSSAQSGVRKEGEDTAEGRQGIRGGGQEERDIGQIIPKGWTKTSSGMMTNPDEKSGGIIDTNSISKKWFFVSNNDAITNQEGFDSWQNAYDALQNALQKIGIKKSENDLVSLFNKLGKQGISNAGEKLIKQRLDADIITAVQSHWLDVLADVGYEKESKSDNPNGKVFIQC